MTDLSELVKPLVWADFDGMGAKAGILGLPVSYLITRWGDGLFEITVSVPGYSAGFDGYRFHANIKAAKDACQADYEARILAALDTDTIERLTAENERLREYVREVAGTEWQETEPDDGWWCEDIGKPYVAEMEHHCNWTVDHAKALLKGKENGE